jgi:hypothetical protein
MNQIICNRYKFETLESKGLIYSIDSDKLWMPMMNY